VPVSLAPAPPESRALREQFEPALAQRPLTMRATVAQSVEPAPEEFALLAAQLEPALEESALMVA